MKFFGRDTILPEHARNDIANQLQFPSDSRLRLQQLRDGLGISDIEKKEIALAARSLTRNPLQHRALQKVGTQGKHHSNAQSDQNGACLVTGPVQVGEAM